MPRKPLLVAVLLLCIAGASSVAYGAFWVTSNTVHVDIQYSVVLYYLVEDSKITFDAAVTNNGNPVRAGINVDFYYSFNAGPWTHFAAQPTNADGVAHAEFIATENGAYDFQATITIP